MSYPSTNGLTYQPVNVSKTIEVQTSFSWSLGGGYPKIYNPTGTYLVFENSETVDFKQIVGTTAVSMSSIRIKDFPTELIQ